MKKSQKKTAFDQLVDKVREHRKVKTKFHEQHTEMLDKWDEILEHEKELVDLLKHQARIEFAARGNLPGSGVVFVDEEGLYVSATQSRVKYIPIEGAYRKARAELPADDMPSLFKFDVKAASEMLSPKIFAKFVVEDEPPTVAVMVK